MVVVALFVQGGLGWQMEGSRFKLQCEQCLENVVVAFGCQDTFRTLPKNIGQGTEP